MNPSTNKEEASVKKEPETPAELLKEKQLQLDIRKKQRAENLRIAEQREE